MLQVIDIFKAFKSTPVLSGASFNVKPGDCLGLLGENGSGKSTLIRIIAQVDRADRGEILASGSSVLGDKLFLRKKLAYVPQEDALAEFLTVKQQLEFWQNAVECENEELIKLFQLDELWKKPIKSLSGGQKKRVSIAMALQSNPEYIVLDEAFSALDAQYKAKLSEWILERQKLGARILLCSHHASELKRLCAQCAVLSQGKVSVKNTDEALLGLSAT